MRFAIISFVHRLLHLYFDEDFPFFGYLCVKISIYIKNNLSLREKRF